MQMGNLGQTTHLPNVLHSNNYPNPQSGQHCLRYHQEVNPDIFFPSDPPVGGGNVYSVVNLAPYIDIYHQYKNLMPDLNWKYYGAGSPDGALRGARGVCEKIRESNVGWHLKPSGGVGHVTKNWFIVGRPLVTNMSPHRRAGGDALALFEPGVTCIDIESGTVAENAKKIRRLLEPEENVKWCKRVNRRFNDIVNYDRIAEQVRLFLERLI
jgi:hypothetical protein